MIDQPHQPDPDSPSPPIVIDGNANGGKGAAHIRIDLAGFPALLMAVKRFRIMQRRLIEEGRHADAAEIDRILTDMHLRI